MECKGRWHNDCGLVLPAVCPNTLAVHCVSERDFATLEVNPLDRMKEEA